MRALHVGQFVSGMIGLLSASAGNATDFKLRHFRNCKRDWDTTTTGVGIGLRSDGGAALHVGLSDSQFWK